MVVSNRTDITRATVAAAGRTDGDVRRSFAAVPTGMALVAASVDGHDEAMLVSSFTSVSLDPPLASMAFTHESTTWPRLRGAADLGITILGESHADLVTQLRGPGHRRLTDVGVDRPGTHALTLPHAAAAFVVRVRQVVVAGDHDLVLFDVLDHRRDEAVAPLTYFDRQVGTIRAGRR